MPWPTFSRRVLHAPGFFIAAGRCVKGAGHSWKGGRDLGTHGLVLLMRGCGTYRDQQERKKPVGVGSLLLLFPGLRHDFGPGAGEIWEEAFLDFDGDLARLLERQGVLDRRAPALKPPASVMHPLRRLIEDIELGTLAAANQAQWRLHGGLLALARWANADTDPALEAGRTVLSAMPGRPLDLRTAAQAAAMGWESFRKRFRERYGMPPARYRQQIRCEAAAERLLHPGATVEQVASELGFCDGAHLRRQFRTALGMSPDEFRRLHL